MKATSQGRKAEAAMRRLPENNRSSGPALRDTKSSIVVNQLATHVPDLVVFSACEKSLPTSQKFEGILMFADISGFTALCERYSMDSRKGGGTDRLSRVLNDYLSKIVENIIGSEGDVLKFAGDAFLALWKIKQDNLDFSLRRVIKCGVRIQDSCDNHDTEVGVKLRVKIGISVGPMRVTTIGNKDCRHFVLSGPAVAEANLAEKFASSGSIILSSKVWAYFPDQSLIEYETLADNRHVSVLDYKTDLPPEDPLQLEPETTKQAWNNLLGPKPKHPSNRRPVSPWRRFAFNQAGRMSVAPPTPARSSVNDLSSDISEAERISVEDAKGRRRRVVFTPTTDDDKTRLRKYIVRPVLQKIDDNLPLEYLSEMRQVSIIFINIMFINGTDIDESGSLQTAFQIIYDSLFKFEGCLNKVFMFDKGCTFLAMFGVPSYKHENDCARALKCAYHINELLKTADSVTQASTGVTTGSTFCGVVGHLHRHEYTVIGKKVNMAARLMMHYPNKVSCDRETFHHAKLHKQYFRELPRREMKGIRDAGVIHEYTEDEGAPGQIVRTRSLLPNNESSVVQEFEYPLLGREEELSFFMEEIKRFLKQRRTKKAQNRHVIVIHGDAGIGKTRVLDTAMLRAGEIGIRIFPLALTINDANIPYYAVRFMLTLLLNMEECNGHLEREQVLLQQVIDEKHKEYLSLLNDLLVLKLPQNLKFLNMNSEQLTKELHRLLTSIINKFASENPIMLAVDDAHFIDSHSWEFLSDLVEHSPTICLFTTRTPNRDQAPLCPSAQKILVSRHTMFIKLRPLDNKYMAALACQILDVVRVPEELVSIIQEKCHGIPSWCEQLIGDMYQTNAIELVPEKSPQGMASRDIQVQPMPEMLQKRKETLRRSRRSSIDGQSHSDQHCDINSTNLMNKLQELHLQATARDDEDIDYSSTDPKMVCILAPGISLSLLSIPDSMTGMLLSRIDHLSPSEQLVAKCAAVLGLNFTREILEAILPKSLHEGDKFGLAVKSLVAAGIFECDSLRITDLTSRRISQAGSLNGQTHEVGHGQRFQIRHECSCPPISRNTDDDDEDPDDNTGRSLCRNLRFTSGLLQETAYNLLLNDQRHKLHRHSAQFLESQAHKCSACGGGDFLPGHERKEEPVQQRRQSVFARGIRTVTQESSRRRVSVVRETSEVDEEVPVERKAKQDQTSSNFISTAKQAIKARRPTPIVHPMARPTKNEEEDEGTADERLTAIEDDDGDSESITAHTGSYKTSVTLRRGWVHDSSLSIISFDDTATSPDCGINFDDLDLRECRCLQVLNSVFPKLVRHWRAATNTYKTIHFLVEAGGAAIATGNNLQALSYLGESKDIIKMLDNGEKPLSDDPENHIVVTLETRGEVESLIGQAHFQMGQMDESLPHFLLALRVLRNTQPRRKISTYIRTIKAALGQTLHRFSPRFFIGRASIRKMDRLLEQARCLSHVWHLYSTSGNNLGALCAALQQVNRAELVDCNVDELINSYINMMECCKTYRWRSLGQEYEKLAMRRCFTATGKVDIDNLVTIGRLYSVSMTIRLGQGHIQGAIDSGYSALKIAMKLHDNGLTSEVLPRLVESLIIAGRIASAEELVEMLQYGASEEEDIVAKTWYYCSSMDVLLESGIIIETHQHCLAFYQNSKNDPAFARDSSSQFCLLAAMSLWYCRLGEWDSAEQWVMTAEQLQPGQTGSYSVAKALLRLAECYLLGYEELLENKSNGKKVINQAKKNSKKFLAQQRSNCKQYPCIKPRHLLLTAYYKMLSAGPTRGAGAAKILLLRCKSISREQGNHQDDLWAQRNEDAWFDKSSEPTDLWQDHLGQSIRGKDHLKKKVKFPLPLAM